MFFDTLNACIEILDIQKPVRVTTRTKDCRKLLAGDCNIVVGKSGIRYHQINLYIPSIIRCNFSLHGILAHELINAWQFENIPSFGDIEYPAHGKLFAAKAEYLSQELETYGIIIHMRDLYNPDTDTP